MDKFVIDIETKNTFADVGGDRNIRDLDISFVGVYSYNQDKFFGFFEHELSNLAPLLQQCGLMIGFAINRFDVPVMAKYLPFNILALRRLDLLEEIETSFGRRVGLDILAKTNLGEGKTGHGLESIKLYEEGKLEELKNYCLQDVRLTRDLYELARSRGYLLVPKRDTGDLVKVHLNWTEEVLPTTLF